MKTLNDRWVALTIFVIALSKVLAMYLHLWQHWLPEDFPVYYTSGWFLRHGLDPYTTDAEALATSLGMVNALPYATDPPTFLLLFAPLTRLSTHAAYWIWQMVNLTAFISGVWILLRPKYSGLPKYTVLSLAGFALMFPPAGNCLAIAQNKMMVLFLLAAMFRLLERGRDGLAGTCLAIAALLRVFPAFLFFYLIVQRRWRAAAFTVGAGLVGSLLTLWGVGLHVFLSFHNGMNTLTRPIFINQASNISIDGILSRLLWAASAPDFLRHLVIVGADLVVITIVVMSSMKKETDGRIFGLWPLAAVLISPTAWYHYMVLSLIPLALMMIAWVKEARVDSWALRLGIAGYITSGAVGLFISSQTPTYGLASSMNLEFGVLAILFAASYLFATTEEDEATWASDRRRSG